MVAVAGAVADNMSTKFKKWIALFSQSGTEIYNISIKLGRFPDLVVCNKQEWDGINTNLVDSVPVVFTEKKPTVEQYRKLLDKDSLVTMHGWLRILPPEICNEYTIYNGHPGLITKHPELKGKDPQKRAVEAKLKTAGCVLHEVVAEVDAGKILSTSEVNIEGKSLDEVFNVLRDSSTDLWLKFLSEKL